VPECESPSPDFCSSLLILTHKPWHLYMSTPRCPGTEPCSAPVLRTLQGSHFADKEITSRRGWKSCVSSPLELESAEGQMCPRSDLALHCHTALQVSDASIPFIMGQATENRAQLWRVAG
jgi:hypothetical protein